MKTWYLPTQQQKGTASIDILAGVAERRMLQPVEQSQQNGVSLEQAIAMVAESSNHHYGTTTFGSKRESPNEVVMFPCYHNQSRLVSQQLQSTTSPPVIQYHINHHPNSINTFAETNMNPSVIHRGNSLSQASTSLSSHKEPAEKIAAQYIPSINPKNISKQHSPNRKSMGYVIPPQTTGQSCKGRKVGRRRCYNEQRGAYGTWEDLHIDLSSNNSMQIHLNRGGKIGIYTNMLPKNKRQSLSTAMHQCKLYRQYTRSCVFHEPRFHVLLSSKAAQCNTGYMYHGIRMKAEPIELVSEVANYANELAKGYNLPENQWDIGVDMIVYRDGDDSIGWHADDSQGESVVLCVVVDAPGEPRPLYIRPKRSKSTHLANGDEEIQLYVGEGDGYDMDGDMQVGYEHSLPKQKTNLSHRFVLLFRHGNEAYVPVDSGESILALAERTKPSTDSEGSTRSLLPLLSRLRVKLP